VGHACRCAGGDDIGGAITHTTQEAHGCTRCLRASWAFPQRAFAAAAH
jgi:hypothetical protein